MKVMYVFEKITIFDPLLINENNAGTVLMIKEYVQKFNDALSF